MMVVEEFEVLPVHPTTGLTAIGLLASGRPVWPVIGAAEDGDGDDPGDGDPDDDGVDGGDDTGTPPEDGWAPPTREQWEEAERKQKRANREAARRRKEMDTLRAEIDALKAQKAGGSDADDADTRRVAAELKDAQDNLTAATKRETAAMKAAARQAIRSAGYTGAADGRMMASLVGMVRIADLDVDDDGEIVGLDDQVEEIKAELPALFAQPEPDKPPKKQAPPRGDTGPKKAPPTTELTWQQKLEAQMKGGG